MITEAYTSMKNTMKYYGDETNPGAHVPFNFALITCLNDHSKAIDFNDTINEWLKNLPKGKRANWVVSIALATDCLMTRLNRTCINKRPSANYVLSLYSIHILYSLYVKCNYQAKSVIYTRAQAFRDYIIAILRSTTFS